jgi:hypothetical protein
MDLLLKSETSGYLPVCSARKLALSELILAKKQGKPHEAYNVSVGTIGAYSQQRQRHSLGEQDNAGTNGCP